ncbi:F-box protein CPR1-like [Papaver somniferum]|uniref:F-box protein CPR1-like n=1 Tax=Papaver somniferum TaxID=3469 RepID=UPI000E6F96C5|nr:F-box protein CPR1-like [Papaver somniferum]
MRGPPGVFVNGASHWLADTYPVRSNNKFSQVLLSFNMAEEVFSELPLLEIFNDNHKFEHKRMDVLDGFLCMLCSHSRVGFEVWMMTRYGVRDSWTKHYAISQSKIDMIPSFRYLRRLHSLKDGEILLEVLLDTWKYDPNRERARLLKIDLEKCKQWRDPYASHLKLCFHMQTYVESLVSLHTGTYVGGGQEESDLDKAIDIAWPSDESD